MIIDDKVLNNLSKYNNIEAFEEQILGCLFLNPDLMKDLTIKEKHFTKNKSLFKFFVQFYETYKTFDISIMSAVCPKNKIVLVNKVIDITNNTIVHTCKFNLYQEYLIKLREEEQLDRLKILKVDDLTNKLILRTITLKEFKTEVEKL